MRGVLWCSARGSACGPLRAVLCAALRAVHTHRPIIFAAQFVRLTSVFSHLFPVLLGVGVIGSEKPNSGEAAN